MTTKQRSCRRCQSILPATRYFNCIKCQPILPADEDDHAQPHYAGPSLRMLDMPIHLMETTDNDADSLWDWTEIQAPTKPEIPI